MVQSPPMKKRRRHHPPRPQHGARPHHPQQGPQGPAPHGAGPVAPPAPIKSLFVAGNVARWARRFRRLAAVITFENEPDWAKLDRLRQVRHGGIGVPRSVIAKLPVGARARFEEKPFLILDHPEDAVARVARTSGPRAPAHIVDAAVHALTFCAPLVLLDSKDAEKMHPLIAHPVAVPGDAVDQVRHNDFEALLRGGTAATQDGYGQLDKSGKAILDLASGRARERTLSGLLQRLVRARRVWAERDAEKRFRFMAEAAQYDATARKVPKGEKDPLTLTQPIVLGYLDLLPLLITRLGPGSDLLPALSQPLAQLSLGVGVVALYE